MSNRFERLAVEIERMRMDADAASRRLGELAVAGADDPATDEYKAVLMRFSAADAAFRHALVEHWPEIREGLQAADAGAGYHGGY